MTNNANPHPHNKKINQSINLSPPEQVPQKEAVQVPLQLTEAQTPQEVALALPRPQEEVVALLLQRETRQGTREGAAEEGAAPHTVQDSQRQVCPFFHDVCFFLSFQSQPIAM